VPKPAAIGAEPFIPDSRDLRRLRAAADACRGCDLWSGATQAVFGDGPRKARMLVVGEQPGDQEDRQGRPFVGPAGRVLREAFEIAQVDVDAVYLTNVVKHFRWEPKGKRRIHKTPSRWQVVACQPWFFAELRAIEPEVIAVLGSVAATALFGTGFSVTRHRGEVLEGPLGVPALITVHPSSVLRGPPEQRRQGIAHLAADLQAAAAMIKD
jgi:uracil-DNA glycosylase